MKARPTSITVISWILIAMGAISLAANTAMINNPKVHELMGKNPIPIPVQHVISYIGLLIMIVSGIAMLKGRNWARYLYVVWSLIGLVIGIVTSPMKAMMIPGLVIFAVIAFFLFRPRATEYFSPAEPSDDAQRV